MKKSNENRIAKQVDSGHECPLTNTAALLASCRILSNKRLQLVIGRILAISVFLVIVDLVIRFQLDFFIFDLNIVSSFNNWSCTTQFFQFSILLSSLKNIHVFVIVVIHASPNAHVKILIRLKPSTS